MHVSNTASSRSGSIVLQVLVLCVVFCMVLVLVRHGAEAMRQKQSMAQCQANLRGLISAVHLYAEDNDGRLPNAVDNTLPRWRWWTDEVFPYAESVRIFYCPEKAPEQFTRAGTSPLLPVIWDHSLLSYGMNYRMGTAHGRDPGLTMQQIEDPARLLLIAESSHYLVRTHPSMWFQDIAPRHKESVNAVFLDGWVENFLLEEGQSPHNRGDGIYDLNLWQIHTR